MLFCNDPSKSCERNIFKKRQSLIYVDWITQYITETIHIYIYIYWYTIRASYYAVGLDIEHLKLIKHI